jgi:GTPase SAR1 family protein
MGCLKRVWKKLFGNTQKRLLLLGLDNAGKTTVLYHLQGKSDSTMPTIGFNVETVSVPPLEFLVWVSTRSLAT